MIDGTASSMKRERTLRILAEEKGCRYDVRTDRQTDRQTDAQD